MVRNESLLFFLLFGWNLYTLCESSLGSYPRDPVSFTVRGDDDTDNIDAEYQNKKFMIDTLIKSAELKSLRSPNQRFVKRTQRLLNLGNILRQLSNIKKQYSFTSNHQLKKRMHVCPFYTRVGFPIGGCLYFYVRNPSLSAKQTFSRRTTTTPQPPRSTSTALTIDYKGGIGEDYNLRWPSLFLLGGSLGKK